MSTQAIFIELMASTGAQKTTTVTTANGTAALCMKGNRRPFGLLLLSEREAIQGSVTASNILQIKVIRPSTVRTPPITRPVGT